MHITQKAKRFFVTLLIAALCCGVWVPSARAAVRLPRALYLEETRPHTCTLISATMLMRSALYCNGSDLWKEIDEETVGNVAWRSGAGLVFSWTLETQDAAITVEHTELSGITEKALKKLLDAHPEGIVFYCGTVPHAVFLTDYADGVFYCADTAGSLAHKRIPLADSWLGERLGHDQDAILEKATAYWAVTAYGSPDAGQPQETPEHVKKQVRADQRGVRAVFESAGG